MKTKLLLTCLLLFGSLASASDFLFSVKNYTEAEKSSTYVRFDMKSTKFGMLTTGFTGFVKQFKVSADVTPKGFKNAVIAFKADAMDTDVGARNDKMWDLCLDYKKYPEISLNLNDVVPFDGQVHEVQGTLNIRGQNRPIMIKVKSSQVNGSFIVSGEGVVDIFELGLPDPSIVIAKVDPKVKLQFHFAKLP